MRQSFIPRRRPKHFQSGAKVLMQQTKLLATTGLIICQIPGLAAGSKHCKTYTVAIQVPVPGPLESGAQSLALLAILINKTN